MASALITYIEDAWIVTGVIWLIGTVSVRRSVRIQSMPSRLLHMGILVSAYVLLFSHGLRLGPLDSRFSPEIPALLYIGFLLTVVGLAFAVWARFFLGRNWSATITVKQKHALVRTGPYALVRHPIYSGITLAMLGTALAFGEIRGLLAVLLAIVGWRLKFRMEESFMTEEFGAEYVNYKQHVKALIPFVW